MKSTPSTPAPRRGPGDDVGSRRYSEHARLFSEAGHGAVKTGAPRCESDPERPAEARDDIRSGQGSRRRNDIKKEAPGNPPRGGNPKPEKVPGR